MLTSPLLSQVELKRKQLSCIAYLSSLVTGGAEAEVVIMHCLPLVTGGTEAEVVIMHCLPLVTGGTEAEVVIMHCLPLLSQVELKRK